MTSPPFRLAFLIMSRRTKTSLSTASEVPVARSPRKGPIAEPSQPALLIRILPAVAILVITSATYLPILQCDFIWDDDTFLTNNKLIQAPDGLRRFWFTTEPPDYFPLVSSMLWVEWRLWGMNATGYHIVNVLLHIISSILLWQLLKKLAIPGAWLAAMIFAIHPVNVETVAWITERKNTLPMVFYLSSMLLYLIFEDQNRRGWYVLALIAFLFALLSKTSVVLMPVVLLGGAWWRRGVIRPRDLWRTAPFFLLAFILGLVTVWFQYHRAIGFDSVRTDDLLSRTVIAGWAVWFYLYKAIVPYPLSFIYPRWQADLSSVLHYVPGLALIICFGLFWRYRRGWGRPFLAALGYYVVMLLPVLGFLNIYFMRYSLVADHWQYFSIPGAIALCIGLAAVVVQRSRQLLVGPALVISALTVGILATLSWRQIHEYKDEDTLWVATLAKNPTASLAHYNLANSLRHDRMDKAVAHYNEAIKHNPEYVDAYINLGNALGMQGKFDEAISCWRTALRFNPNVESAHDNMGVTLLAQNKADDAAVHLATALRLNPQNTATRFNLTTALVQQGKQPEAIKHLQEVVRMAPNHFDAHFRLGVLLAQSGRKAEALQHLRAAVRLKPDSEQARQTLAIVEAAP